MSIRVMSKVWDQSAAKGSSLLVLLAIADFASDDGGSAFPSIPTLARKVRMSDRQVQRIIQGLADLGELATIPGPTPHSSNSYQVVIDALGRRRPGDKMTPRPGDNLSPDGVMGDTPLVSPATPPGDIAMSPDPLVNRQNNRQGKEDQSIDAGLRSLWLETLAGLRTSLNVHTVSTFLDRGDVIPVRREGNRIIVSAPAALVPQLARLTISIEREIAGLFGFPVDVVFVGKEAA